MFLGSARKYFGGGWVKCTIPKRFEFPEGGGEEFVHGKGEEESKKFGYGLRVHISKFSRTFNGPGICQLF